MIDLNKLERQTDAALAAETPQSLQAFFDALKPMQVRGMFTGMRNLTDVEQSALNRALQDSMKRTPCLRRPLRGAKTK